MAVGACGNRAAIFQGAVGAFWASTAPAASTASVVVGRTRALPQAIALAGHLDDRRVREEAIENRGGRGHVAEEDAPILRRPIRRDQRRRRFVTPHKDLEEVLGRIRGRASSSRSLRGRAGRRA